MALSVLLLLLVSAVAEARSIQSHGGWPGSPHSPLDNAMLWPFQVEGSSPLPSPLSHLPSPLECSSACSTPLMDTLKMLFREGNNTEIMQLSCQHYSRAVDCLESLPECGPHELFDKLSSGLYYMCIEQRPAFDSVIGCVDTVVSSVQSECKKECRVESLMTGLVLKDTLAKGFTTIDSIITPHMTKIVMNEGCRIGQCLLKCFRSKLNARCDGSAGSLLTEAIIRPLLTESNADLPFGALFGVLLPPSCGFLLDKKALTKLRLDPQIDLDLKRVYKNKQSQPSADRLFVDSIFSAAESAPLPLNPASRLQKERSPIDSAYASSKASFRGHTSMHAEADFFRSLDMAAELEERQKQRSELNRQLAEEMKELREEEEEGSAAVSSMDSDEKEGSGDTEKTESLFTSSNTTSIHSSTTAQTLSSRHSKRHLPPGEDEIDAVLREENLDPNEVDSVVTEDTTSWTEVTNRDGQPREGDIKVHYDGSSDSLTVLRLHRTADNADFFVSQRVESARDYRVELRVEPKDTGELVCILRTDKGEAVNRTPRDEDEIQSLISDL